MGNASRKIGAALSLSRNDFPLAPLVAGGAKVCPNDEVNLCKKGFSRF